MNQQQIAQLIPVQGDASHMQYRQILLSTPQEMNDLYALATHYAAIYSKSVEAAIADMFSLKAADWMIRCRVPIDPVSVAAVNTNNQTYQEIKQSYNNSVAQSRQTQQMSAVGINPNTSLGMSGMNTGIANINNNNMANGYNTASQTAAAKLGATAGMGVVNTFQTAVQAVPAVSAAGTATPQAGITAAAIRPAIADTTNVPPHTTESTYDTLTEYIHAHDLYNYIDIMEAYMDQTQHVSINTLLEAKLDASPAVVARRAKRVLAKSVSKQTDVQPSTSAVHTKDSEVNTNLNPQELYSTLATAHAKCSETNKNAPRVHRAIKAHTLFANNPEVINTTIIPMLVNGGLTVSADNFLEHYTMYVEEGKKNHADMCVIKYLNNILTKYVNEYIAHRWNGVISIDNFMTDYNVVSVTLTNDYDISRAAFNAMSSGYRRNITECGADVDGFVAWGERRTGILLNRGVRDLAWECVTDIPVALDDLRYNNLISMIKDAEALNTFVWVYADSSCFKVLVTSEMKITVAKVY